MQSRTEKPISVAQIVISILFGLSIAFISYIPDQNQFFLIIFPYALAFIIYLHIISKKVDKTLINYFLGVGILTRFVLLFSFPNLSDDVYRFLWDGRLWQAGINAYGFLPTEVFEINKSLSAELFSQLNSQQYYTIYPPVSQLTFYIATLPFWESMISQVIVLKVILFIAEIGSIFIILKILEKLNYNRSRSLIYVLNPLIILEITGNLHYEGLLIFFFLLFYLFAIKGHYIKSSIFLGLSAATKLLPLMFIPLLFKRLKKDELIVFLGLFSITILALFYPVIFGFKLVQFSESLDLYFRRFEFNGNLYYVLRWVGLKLSGYNLIRFIGPGLGILAMGFIFYIGLRKQDHLHWKSFPKYALLTFCIYLLSATTIHPWYLSLPILLCLFTEYRFPIIWSGLIFLTYINYTYVPYHENLWIVFIEYAAVLFYLIMEYRKLDSPALRDTA